MTSCKLETPQRREKLGVSWLRDVVKTAIELERRMCCKLWNLRREIRFADCTSDSRSERVEKQLLQRRRESSSAKERAARRRLPRLSSPHSHLTPQAPLAQRLFKTLRRITRQASCQSGISDANALSYIFTYVRSAFMNSSRYSISTPLQAISCGTPPRTGHRRGESRERL